MREAREDGFFVTYNHPVWSLESKEEYLRYHGMHAMEIVNYSSVVTGHEEHGGILYDNLLHSGEKIFCVAADDNHNVYDITHPKCDSFGGFTVIKAERLEYGAVSRALLEGSFYASEGPLIRELYYDSEDGRIHIKTTEAVRIVMSTGQRYHNAKTAPLKGETITEATFKLDKGEEEYVRFVVRDREGKEAYTNAYTVGEILAKCES